MEEGKEENEINLAPMRADTIAVIIFHDSQCEVRIDKQVKILTPKDVWKVLGLSFFGIIAVSVIFAVPWTTIPRTDSIIYQSLSF